MFGFVCKSFFGFILLIFFCFPKKYKENIRKKLNLAHIWHSAIDRVDYLFPEKIIVFPHPQGEKVGVFLMPGRYYDIYCTTGCQLSLEFKNPEAAANQIYKIKRICGGDSSRITIKTTADNKIRVEIDSVNLSRLAVLDIGPNIDCKIRKDRSSRDSSIVCNFESWQDLRNSDLKVLPGITPAIEQFIKR